MAFRTRQYCINCRKCHKFLHLSAKNLIICLDGVILMPQEVFSMIDSHELKKRDIYLKKLIGFQDTEPVKVITGIRRCGKSSLLKLMVQHLKRYRCSAGADH